MRVEFGPSAIILESGVQRMWSISSRKGVQMRGKAETQEVVMPTRCTPWPEQERLVIVVQGGEEHEG